MEGDEDVEVVVREYREDIDIGNNGTGVSSRQTSALQGMCRVPLDLAEQMWKKQAERMLSILQNRICDFAVLRTTVKTLKDCEDVLKNAAEKFFKESDLEGILSKWKKTVKIWRS